MNEEPTDGTIKVYNFLCNYLRLTKNYHRMQMHVERQNL